MSGSYDISSVDKSAATSVRNVFAWTLEADRYCPRPRVRFRLFAVHYSGFHRVRFNGCNTAFLDRFNNIL